jgi:hypothetical protein
LLYLLEIHEDHTNEEVEEKKGPDQDKADIKVSVERVLIGHRPSIFPCRVHCLIHKLVPVIQRAHYEEG